MGRGQETPRGRVRLRGEDKRQREKEGGGTIFKKKSVLGVDSSRILLNSRLPVLKLRLRRSSNLYSSVKT